MAKKITKGKGHRGSEVKTPPKGSGGPPSVKARQDRAKSTREPPPVKYAGKKKPPKKGWGQGGFPPGYTRPDMPDWGDMPWPPKGFEGKPPPRPKPRKPKKPMTVRPRKAKKAPTKRKK